MYDRMLINEALDYTRNAIMGNIESIIARKRKNNGAYQPLYDLLSEYPFRKGKALRPTLCISVTRAAGGMAQAALISSTALELYHNAFLIHDDIEDGSEHRRGKDTLHRMVGVPRAVNIGDATNVLAVSLLLDNLENIGVAKTLQVIREIENMALQSVEGQSMELDWVADNIFDLTDEDYFRMCNKKTCWYTFITPCRIGYIVGLPYWQESELTANLATLTEFGMYLGIAFQIQDDILNLIGEEEKYGKEISGDLYEGKRTIMLNHVIAQAGSEAKRIKEIIGRPREQKKQDDIEYVLDQMHQYGSIKYGKNLANRCALKAAALLDSMDFLQPATNVHPGESWKSEVADFRFLRQLVNYVIERDL